MTAAPYFHTNFTEEVSKELTEQVQQRFLNVVENLSKTLGLNVRQVFDNLGGFHDDKLNSQVRELSYTIEFDDADIDKINLFTCLLGDLGHEVQNSVYNIRYTDKDDTKANGIEYTLKCDTSDRHKLADKFEELGIENYSIDRDGIHMLYFNGEDEAKFLEKWNKVKENIEGEGSAQRIHSNYFEAADRAKLYDEELKKFGEDNTQTNLHQDLYDVLADIAYDLEFTPDMIKEVSDMFKGFSYEQQEVIAKNLQTIYDKNDNLQSKFDAYIQGLTGKELKESKEDNVQINQDLRDVITDIAKDLDWDFDAAFKGFSKEKQKSVANDLNYIYSHEDSRALRGIVEGYLYRLKDDSPILHSDLDESISDIADRLGWDDNTRKTIFNKFREISYEKQKQIGDDLYNISMEPGSIKEVQSKVDKYINKLEEELKTSKEKNAPKSEEELKKLRETYPQVKEDLFNTITTIADELGIKPDSYLKEVDLDYSEKIQDQITEDLKKLRERSGYSKGEVDSYFEQFDEYASPLISNNLYNNLLDLLEALGLKGQSLYDTLENKYLSKFEKFSYEQQDKFAKELEEIYEKYKDNKQELQSQLDKYIDNLNVKLKNLEEDDLRRKKENEQRVITVGNKRDAQDRSKHEVRKQDGRLRELLNEALETNQKYRDSGGTAAIQTGETLKEGTNAITPGQTYEDYVKENQDGVAYFEAFIPVYNSIFKEFASREGTISVEALEYLHPDIMKMIVYRIPTEGRHSIMPVKGIQFMPIEMGGTIMLPDEMIHLLKQTI